MKEFDVIGLGNSLVDILLELTDGEFAALGFEKGTMRLVEPAEQAGLLAAFRDHEPRLVSGGSVANSVIACSQLGGKGAFLGCVGDDRYGLHYATEFQELNIDFANAPLVGETTGTCVSIITPDAERTMRTSLAVSSHLAARHVRPEKVSAATWLFVEGYVFANPSTGQHAIREAVRAAKAHGTKVALTCSDAFIPQVFGEPFREALAQSDLLFCNATEAMAVAGGYTAEESFQNLKALVPGAVVTDGPNGAFVRYDGEECHVPAFACHPVDLTGAGDMFAGAFLYGVTRNVAPQKAARAANFLAMKVITQIGARLHHGARQFWDEAAWS
ncbi:carbohydrate family : Carbohydrate kinase, PfkB family OS=Leptospira licerasiae str. MMD4847 GN=LEP1GSC178_2428 PE=4 SV=1: PfkB [Gemmataceae bacterium]|nr:carbohydrate family : Carbohydrate kinase, PfkB family OS=Leptospira licerasiae str. MMD4847 GN=LEP1GSC178_2428 PE=4 SV=1: PfkB [Gemmataceae bacterium]VTT98690.1 carbohydrate family : Carbohydrate kinase, PfkB family OS=Leptospira licerasiae str. MMD4847 GN=LEP1GSC178_2428 PE=4 SV=1: PfkB [Gemmataceae bacterium]